MFERAYRDYTFRAPGLRHGYGGRVHLLADDDPPYIVPGAGGLGEILNNSYV
jgi:hypothetical protein